MPGHSAGILSIAGAYTQGSAGALNIEVGGTGVGTGYDRLAVTGAATLGGMLNVSLINGFTPGSADEYTILTAGSISGTFSTVNLPATAGGTMRVVYHPTSVSLVMCYANCDGSTVAPVLNVNDFVCFQSKFAAGDPYANCDGSTAPPVLNINDFVCFQTRFAQGCQ